MQNITMRKTAFVVVLVASLLDIHHAADNFEASLHPMLYFSKAELARMRVQATFSHLQITDRIYEAAHALKSDQWKYLPPKDNKAFTASWNEQYGNNLCAFSFYCVLFPDDKNAFHLVRTFMSRMATYDNWYVDGSQSSELGPLVHNLIGFVTAYDFLYDRLDSSNKRFFYQKIKSVSSDLYNGLKSEKCQFIRQYTHNQGVTNVIGLLLAALVVSVHEPTVVQTWINFSKEYLDFTMRLLSFVVDGSNSEGVSYGSYTSRGLTEFVFLSRRHFNTDYSHNIWLRQHLWFYYHTTLPGFQRTIGIADSNFNWLYGPESQIVFLDDRLLKSGVGNQLAAQIRAAKVSYKPIAPSSTQIWSTLHTEFIFFNASLRSWKEVGKKFTKMHIFSDWGVVTYGGGQPLRMGNTFLSFKAGITGGEAARYIIHSKLFKKRIDGWNNFKPGHEHPDQNSFIFAPNGRYVVSEALHGPKLTYLENTLIFSPNSTRSCYPPWQGQLGECDKWLKYNDFTSGDIRAEVLTAATSGDMLFVVGEAVNTYPADLDLSSVQRSILLLNPEVLLVVDTVRKRPSSTTKKASALFNNIWKEFSLSDHLGFKGAKVDYPEGSYSFFSTAGKQSAVNVSVHNRVQPDGLKEGPTNYANVTFDLYDPQTTVVNVFHGPNYQVTGFAHTNLNYGVSINLKVNEKNYSVDISTMSKSISRDIHPISERHRITEYPGFAKLWDGVKHHYFGLDNPLFKSQKFCDKNNDNRVLIENGGFLYSTSFYSVDDCIIDVTQEKTPADKQSENLVEETSNATTQLIDPLPKENVAGLSDREKTFLKLFLVIFWIVVVICVATPFRFCKREVILRRSGRSHQSLACTAGCCFIIMVIVNLVCIDQRGQNICLQKENFKQTLTAGSTSTIASSTKLPSKRKFKVPHDPFIMITSLPGSGSNLLEKSFDTSNLLNYFTSSDFRIPLKHRGSMDTDLCVWSRSSERVLIEATWESLLQNPILYFNQLNGDIKIKHRVRSNPNAPFVFNDDVGFWTTKLPWIGGSIQKDLQPIFVVRDPRSWIHMFLTKTSGGGSYEKTFSELIDILERMPDKCNKAGSSLPQHYDHFKELSRSQRSIPDDIEKLAMVWSITVETVLDNVAKDGNAKWPLHIVRFEDILSDPERVITDMFAKLGFPLEIKSLNQITRVVKSGEYQIAYDGKVSEKLSDTWKSGMAEYDIKKIENICSKFMKILRYK